MAREPTNARVNPMAKRMLRKIVKTRIAMARRWRVPGGSSPRRLFKTVRELREGGCSNAHPAQEMEDPVRRGRQLGVAGLETADVLAHFPGQFRQLPGQPVGTRLGGIEKLEPFRPVNIVQFGVGENPGAQFLPGVVVHRGTINLQPAGWQPRACQGRKPEGNQVMRRSPQGKAGPPAVIGQDEDKPEQNPGRNKKLMIKKIVAAVDLLSESENVLEAAGEIAGKLGAELSVLHLYESGDTMASFSPYLYPGDDSYEQYLEEEKKRLREMVDQLRSRHQVTVKGSMKADRPVPGILGFVESEGADLLVIGTHRPGRLERALLGSVSEAIIRQVKVPVLVIPPHDKA